MYTYTTNLDKRELLGITRNFRLTQISIRLIVCENTICNPHFVNASTLFVSFLVDVSRIHLSRQVAAMAMTLIKGERDQRLSLTLANFQTIYCSLLAKLANKNAKSFVRFTDNVCFSLSLLICENVSFRQCDRTFL